MPPVPYHSFSDTTNSLSRSYQNWSHNGLGAHRERYHSPGTRRLNSGSPLSHPQATKHHPGHDNQCHTSTATSRACKSKPLLSDTHENLNGAKPPAPEAYALTSSNPQVKSSYPPSNSKTHSLEDNKEPDLGRHISYTVGEVDINLVAGVAFVTSFTCQSEKCDDIIKEFQGLWAPDYYTTSRTNLVFFSISQVIYSCTNNYIAMADVIRRD